MLMLKNVTKKAEKDVYTVLTEFLPFKSRVRNKNAAIFSLNSVKHLPFAKICIDLDDKHEKDILGLYRLTNSEFLEVVFRDEATDLFFLYTTADHFSNKILSFVLVFY